MTSTNGKMQGKNKDTGTMACYERVNVIGRGPIRRREREFWKKDQEVA